MRMGRGAATVQELAKPFQISAPAISKHIKVLEKAGLITREKDAQWRRCRIEAARLKEASEFIEKYRRFWEDSFDRLEVYLRKLQSESATVSPLAAPAQGSQPPTGVQSRGGAGQHKRRKKNEHKK